jgi:predicted DNA-binding WGR domain protein
MKRYFICQDDKSDKFWSVQVEENQVITTFGKISTAGKTNTKEFETTELAQQEAEKLIKEKVSKGYKQVIDNDAGKFSEVEFWSLIERTKRSSEDTSEQAEQLIEILSTRALDDIFQFEHIFTNLYFQSYQSRLWAAAYLINGGCSDDGFDYFRAWLIAQGKEVFAKTVENPDFLAKYIKAEQVGEEVECEDILYVAARAFEQKTGKTLKEFYKITAGSTYPDIVLDWEEDNQEQLKQMLPKIYKKFMEQG